MIGDVFEEADKAIRFVGERDASALATNEMALYAAERAIGNTTEACIRLEREGYKGRFEKLFPDHVFTDIRDIGNAARHDYDWLNVLEVHTAATVLMPPLRDRADDLLAAHRRLHGG